MTEQRPHGRLKILLGYAAGVGKTFKMLDEAHELKRRGADVVVECAGVPQAVHDAADARLLIPMRPGMRSLNMAQAAAMVLGEALRQTDLFPGGIGQQGAGK